MARPFMVMRWPQSSVDGVPSQCFPMASVVSHEEHCGEVTHIHEAAELRKTEGKRSRRLHSIQSSLLQITTDIKQTSGTTYLYVSYNYYRDLDR